MRPHGAGARPEPGSLHIHFYKQLAPSQQLMGWEWCSCTKSFPEKKHFQLQTYLSLSSWVCFVSVSELKRQGRGECFWLGVFYLKTFFNNDLHVKEIPFWPTFRSPGRKYSVSSHSWEVEISLYSQIGSGCTSRGTRGFSLLPTRELKTLPQPCVHVCVRTHTHTHTLRVRPKGDFPFPEDGLGPSCALCTVLADCTSTHNLCNWRGVWTVF